MSTGTSAIRFLASALARAADAWSDPELTRSFLRDLGWSLATVPAPIAALAAPATALADLWRELEHDEPSLEQAARLAEAVRVLWTAVRGLDGIAEPAEVAGAGFVQDLARSIADYWIVEALDRDGWFTLPVLELLGVVEVRYIDDAPPRRAHFRRRVHWDRLPQLLSDPAAGFRERFGWGTAEFDADGVLSRIRELLTALRWSAALGEPPPRELAAAGTTSDGSVLGVDLQLLGAEGAGGWLSAGVRFVPLAPPGVPPGLGLVPYVSPGLGTSFPLDDHVDIAIDATFDLQGGVVLSWLPTRGLELIVDLDAGGATRTTGHAALRMIIDDPAKPEKPLIDALGFALIARTAQGQALLELEPEPAFAVEAEIKDGVVRWDSSQAPGVLARLFGDRKLEAAAAIGVGWSSHRGFYLRGSTTLGTAIPTQVSVGPVTLRAIRVAIEPIDAGAAIRIGTDGRVAIGPVALDWQGLGVRAGVRRGDGDHPVELVLDAALPDTVALAVDTPIVSGGGSVQRLDADHYAGELALRALGIEIRAVASVAHAGGTTSIAAIAAARWPGIPIGLGFVLEGMNAVLGIHRRVDVEACRARLTAGGVTALLSGTGDAAQTLTALEAVFPVAIGRHVVGLGPTIGWGSPRMVRADLAVMLELPAPIRAIVMAAARVGLPTLAKPIVDLRIDAIGVLDFDRRTFALDASLHDSSIAGYALTGDLALRTGWGDDPTFALSIGGFHPRFTPPAGFPTLRRLGLTVGDQPQLRLEAYLALTTNTAQLGARADLTYSGGGFAIAGHLGFDALLELSPFHFEIDISASASITWHGHRLLSVDLDFLLSGPHPWRAKGHASFGILWWDVSVGFDVTWGDATPLPPPALPDLAAALRDALGRTDAWTGELPDGERAWIVVGDRPAPAGVVRVHPLAVVDVRQRMVPLDQDVALFGAVPLPVPRRFSIISATVATTSLVPDPVDDLFAPAQFTPMTDDERLTAPAFERFHAGARIGADRVAHGATFRLDMDQDTFLVDPLAEVPRPPRTIIVDVVATAVLVAQPSRPPAPPPRRGPRLRDAEFALVSTDDLSTTATSAVIAAGARTHAGLRTALARSGVSGLQIVPRAQVANAGAEVVPVRPTDAVGGEFVEVATGRALSRDELADLVGRGRFRPAVGALLHRTPR